jgi:hypothetical protein
MKSRPLIGWQWQVKPPSSYRAWSWEASAQPLLIVSAYGKARQATCSRTNCGKEHLATTTKLGKLLARQSHKSRSRSISPSIHPSGGHPRRMCATVVIHWLLLVSTVTGLLMPRVLRLSARSVIAECLGHYGTCVKSMEAVLKPQIAVT